MSHIAKSYGIKEADRLNKMGESRKMKMRIKTGVLVPFPRI